MKLQNKIKQAKSTDTNPSEIVQDYLEFDEAGKGNFIDWLRQFDFDSEYEIERAVSDFAYCVCGDRYMSNKFAQENRVHVRCIYKRFNDILTHLDKADKYAKDIAGRLWNGYYSRHLIDIKTAAMFEQEPNEHDFSHACDQIKEIYGLTDNDLQKIWFFVEQVKAGTEFPNSLRRMLYLWGKGKQTGKTTTASTMCCILNGGSDIAEAYHFQTVLSNEMQIGGFKVPKISSCNVCMMDECFYADMGKTYSDFKRFLTSSNGRARLPYGQEFEWYGLPNYIATSNDSLKVFIKDWDDRRYLSVEFKNKPTRQLTFEEIMQLWMLFIKNSRKPSGYSWKQWSDAIAEISNEQGERTEFANEFENDMLQNEFASYILARPFVSNSPTNNANRITLKFFIDYFAEHNADARKRRGEIEAAAVRVFGEKYNGNGYWLLSDLRRVAERIKSDNAIDNSLDDEKEVF